jgi:Fe-S-cluster containining protein
MSEHGLCCRRFQLDCGPEELYRKIREKKIRDGNLLLEILRYIGYRPYTCGNYSPECIKRNNPSRKEALIHLYTCVRLDHKTGRCKDHDLRPMMCKVYNHGFCEHAHRCESLWCSEHPDNITPEERIVKAGTIDLKEAVAELKVQLGAGIDGKIPLIGKG